MKSGLIKNHILISLILMATLLFFISCSKNESSIEPTPISQAAAADDAAEIITTNIASTNVGAFDQIEDVLQISSLTGLVSTSNDPITNFIKGSKQITRSYDSLTGWWTINVTKQRGVPGNPYYASFTHIYKHQFLKKNGQFQKYYITINPDSTVDTAYTIIHQIVSGSGSLITPKSSNHLISLSGGWIVTNANSPIVTINTLTNQPYRRVTSDTLTRANAVRTLNSELTLNFNNVTGPRGSGLNWHNKTSGTITGNYHALVTFQKGDVYREKEINRDINITLGQGVGYLNLSGFKYKFKLETGEIFK